MRKVIWHELTCPWCGRMYLSPGARRLATCGQRSCIDAAQHHNGQRAGRGTPERAVNPAILKQRGPAYHQCGDKWVAGTDGMGRVVLWCERCQLEERVPIRRL